MFTLHTSVGGFSSSIASSTEKGLLGGDLGEGGGGGLLFEFGSIGDGGEEGFFFFVSLNIREGFLKYLDEDGIRRRDVRKYTTRQYILLG